MWSSARNSKNWQTEAGVFLQVQISLTVRVVYYIKEKEHRLKEEMQLARHKSGKHTSCLAVTRKPVALGPCLTTYSGKIWSISYLGISELLSNPAGCYWKDSRPRRHQLDIYISIQHLFLFNCISAKHKSTQFLKHQREKKKDSCSGVVWGLLCVRENGSETSKPCDKLFSPGRLKRSITLHIYSFLSRKEAQIIAGQNRRRSSSLFKKD